MLYKWVKDENCILVLYCSFFQDRLGPLAQHPNSKFYPSCCFRYSWSKPVFRDLKPSCFAYSTNYTQDLLARDKMNLETMEDTMPLLLYSYTTQTLALVSLVLLSNHPQDTISSLCDSAFLPPEFPWHFPLPAVGSNCSLWKATGCHGFPFSWSLSEDHQKYSSLRVLATSCLTFYLDQPPNPLNSLQNQT